MRSPERRRAILHRCRCNMALARAASSACQGSQPEKTIRLEGVAHADALGVRLAPAGVVASRGVAVEGDPDAQSPGERVVARLDARDVAAIAFFTNGGATGSVTLGEGSLYCGPAPV